MPTLDWIGKNAVIRHHKEVPFRLLEPDVALSHGGAETGNLIVQGDNLHALKALLPKYAGKVKCIYIDPPYNTGNEGWVYNDKVNSPEINRWLGSVVGKEAEDLSRHDKWLCMMYPRMVLLKQFLADDGAIFVSIDDNEVASLRLLMDEIFGKKNFVATILWQKVYSPKNTARHFSEDHDYVVVYATKSDIWSPRLLPRTEKQDNAYKNPDKDFRGVWKTSDLSARNFYSEGTYLLTTPSGRVIDGPPRGRYWTISKTEFERLDAEDRIWWGKDGGSIPQRKRFLTDVKAGVVPQTMWFYQEVGHSQEGKQEVVSVLDFETSDDVFITPKPTRLIQRILQIASDKDSIILDSFAGSGTTGHAVLKQNAEDGGNRKFILVEMEEKIAQDITAERVRRVAGGYTNAKGEAVEGLGSGFQFCRLSEEPLFNEFGDCRDDVTFAQLADFVWFAETGEGYMEKGIASPFFSKADGGGSAKGMQSPFFSKADGGGSAKGMQSPFFSKADGGGSAKGIASPFFSKADGGGSAKGMQSPFFSKADGGGSAKGMQSPSPYSKGMQSPSPYSPLLGVHGGVAVYLLFNGILGDRRPAGGNILTTAVLASLPEHDGLRVIYAAAVKGIGPAALARANIVFKQTPYAIEV